MRLQTPRAPYRAEESSEVSQWKSVHLKNIEHLNSTRHGIAHKHLESFLWNILVEQVPADFIQQISCDKKTAKQRYRNGTTASQRPLKNSVLTSRPDKRTYKFRQSAQSDKRINVLRHHPASLPFRSFFSQKRLGERKQKSHFIEQFFIIHSQFFSLCDETNCKFTKSMRLRKRGEVSFQAI